MLPTKEASFYIRNNANRVEWPVADGCRRPSLFVCVVFPIPKYEHIWLVRIKSYIRAPPSYFSFFPFSSPYFAFYEPYFRKGNILNSVKILRTWWYGSKKKWHQRRPLSVHWRPPTAHRTTAASPSSRTIDRSTLFLPLLSTLQPWPSFPFFYRSL